MNERIKQLKEQAMEWVPNMADPDTKIRLLNAGKFAELIVRECCIALNPMLRDMISRGQGVDLIKLHFGMNPKEITTAMLDAAITQCEQELAKKKSGVDQ
jgi:hypothetical protein